MNFILKFHNYLAFLGLILLIFFVIYNFVYLNKSSLSLIKTKKKLSLLILSAVHIQLLLGIFLLYRYVSLLSESQVSFGMIMKNSALRYKVIEHPMTMLIGAIFITLSHRSIKTQKENAKKSLVFLLLASVFILSRLPFDSLLKR